MITITTKIQDEGVYPLLLEVNRYLSKIKRHLFVDLYIHKKELKVLKTEYITKYQITGRHFNSITNELNAEISSNYECLKLSLSQKNETIKGIQKKISKIEKDNEDFKKKINAIDKYIIKAQEWKIYKKGKKPKLKVELRNINKDKLVEKISENSFICHQKKRALFNFQHKKGEIEKRLESTPQMCFGSKKLFKAQYHLIENELKNHQEWKEKWDIKRNKSSFWIGSHDERRGNLNAQYDENDHLLQLRLPNIFDQKYLILKNIFFPYGQDQLVEALYYESLETNKKGQSILKNKAVSYRIEYKNDAFYLSAMFEEKQNPIITSLHLGTIGIDLNADHLAVVEVDRFGNPIKNSSYYFDFKKKSSEQIEAVLSDFLSSIVRDAFNEKKPIVVENIDFTKKKMRLKEIGNKSYSKMLSSFAYSKFFELLISKGKKYGVEIISVNPAFTSIIGYQKFLGYNHLTFHEKAALAIARRGLKFSERPKQKVALSEPVRIHDPDEVDSTKNGRHVWSYWRSQTKSIRLKIMNSSKVKSRTLSRYPLFPTGIQCDLRKAGDYLETDYGDLLKRFNFLNCFITRGIYCSFPVYLNFKFKI